MTTAPALRPCPFCGGDAELSHVLASVGRNYFAVECADKRGCRVVVSSRAATEAEAIAAWNARPGGDEAAIAEAIQALIDAGDYFSARADVNDGDYGVPSPNREMTLASQCDEALERLEALRARADGKGEVMTNGNFTNGSLVFRIWRFDGGCDLLGKFQYRSDAEAFAQMCMDRDTSRGANKSNDYFYLAVCESEIFAKAFGAKVEKRQ